MQNKVQTPDWVKHAVFYQIFPDRFAKSDWVKKPNNLEPWDAEPTVYGMKGGDLLGVAEHFDYLQDLGINAIYFNPIFQSASNHRYHTHDYYQVDPILGGNRAFRIMLDEAHERGIKVVLDGVFNHASRGFFQFNSILELGESSPYLDWFTVTGYPLNAYDGAPNYRAWVGLPALPAFNTDNPQVREYIFDIARYWLEQGIDGWRLDVPFEIKDDAFWQAFQEVVKTTNPEAYIVGEIPWEAQKWLQGDQFDAVMNYQFTQACLGFFGGSRIDREVERNMMGLPAVSVLDAPAFARRAHELLHLYPRQIALAQLNLLSSHDMPRFITLVGGDTAALKLAALFQMTYPGAPCIYYGDEIGMQGGMSGPPEPARRAFPWEKPETWDTDLLEYMKGLIALRKAHPALRTGEFITLYAEEQVYAFLRRQDGEQFVVVLNNSEAPLSWELALDNQLPDGSQWRAVFGAGEAQVQANALVGLDLPARTGTVLTVAR
jgi:cyclomaltodextrinase / maltogenic alpha-amylase / neopullulanase